MKKFASAALLALLSACGSFQLSSGAIPLTAKTEAEMRLDNLTCEKQAAVEANTAGNQAQAFALGATIVGAPLAYELEKKRQRESYAKCMTASGYKVLPPAEGDARVSATALSATLPPGWKARALTRSETMRGMIVFGSDAANDLHAYVTFAPKVLEPSTDAMLGKRSAGLAALLDGGASSQAEAFQIGAQKAYRTTVSGKSRANGVPLNYVVTAIDGKEESAYIVAWTTAAAFPVHRGTLESVAHRVSGLK